MLVLPLPMLSFLLATTACVLAWKLDLGLRIARDLFVTFFAVIAAGSLMVGLRFGYGIDALIPIQRMVPLFVGPLLYLGFAVLALSQPWRIRLTILHLAVAFLLAIAVPATLGRITDMDTIIAASYCFYILLILRLWWHGPNHLRFARLEFAVGLRHWMLAACAFLLVFLLIDAAIALSFIRHQDATAVRLISYGSLILILALVTSIVIVARKTANRHNRSAPPIADPEAVNVEIKAREFLEKSRLYLDTDLSVERLAKRLHLPVRVLSSAINQTRGQNISQYVNEFRLAHAAQLLRSTNLSVAKVMEQSGFLTRSNFYREFQRGFDMSPAEFRRQNSPVEQ